MAELGFSKQKRLLKPAEFQRVFAQANLKASTRNLLLLAAPNKLTHARVGFVISRKQVQHAVHRNRIKRIIREYFRIHCDEMPSVDIIVLAKKGFDGLSNDDINNGFASLWLKLISQAHSKRGINA
jgi:ribonuclease P protein component